MKPNRKTVFAALALAAFATGALAETPASGAPATGNPAAVPAPSAVTVADVQALKDALAAQQQQIERLTEQLQRQQVAAEAMKTTATPAVPSQVADAQPGIVIQQDGTPGLQPNPQNAEEQGKASPMESPVIAIHFRGISITPGGYVEGAFVRRSRALGADLPTPFNSVTMPGASQSHVSEFFGSGRQSKITTFVDGRLKNVDLSSYVSADFLSAGVTSTSIVSPN